MMDEIARRARAGDPHALDRALRDVESDVRLVLQHELRSRPDIPLEDAVQEVRLYIARRIDRYDDQYPFDTFARGLARTIARRLRGQTPPGSPYEPDDHREGWAEQDAPAPLRRAMGEGRFRPPGGAASAIAQELLELLFVRGGYPHQSVSFGYSVLIFGRAKARGRARVRVGVTGDPERVVREVGPLQMTRAALELVDELGESFGLSVGSIARIRELAADAVRPQHDSLFQRDPASRRLFASLLRQTVAETHLSEYFGRDPRKSVADWTHVVKRRLREALNRPLRPAPEAAQ